MQNAMNACFKTVKNLNWVIRHYLTCLPHYKLWSLLYVGGGVFCQMYTAMPADFTCTLNCIKNLHSNFLETYYYFNCNKLSRWDWIQVLKPLTANVVYLRVSKNETSDILRQKMLHKKTSLKVKEK